MLNTATAVIFQACSVRRIFVCAYLLPQLLLDTGYVNILTIWSKSGLFTRLKDRHVVK